MIQELLLQVLYAASWPIKAYEEGWDGILQLREYFGIRSFMEVVKDTCPGAAYFYGY